MWAMSSVVSLLKSQWSSQELVQWSITLGEEEKRKRRVFVWLRVRIHLGMCVGTPIYIRSHEQVLGKEPIMIKLV